MAKVENSPIICKATLFVGLNDKDSKLQEVSTLEASKVLSNLVCSYFDGGTITEATGIYRHNDGTGVFVVENTLKIEILFFGQSRQEARAELVPFVGTVKKTLNQESVAVQLEEIESELM